MVYLTIAESTSYKKAFGSRVDIDLSFGLSNTLQHIWVSNRGLGNEVDGVGKQLLQLTLEGKVDIRIFSRDHRARYEP